MQRSSETIGAIAAALAKAQIELINPEKSLTGTVSSESPREDGRTFRYASLSSGLEIVRKCLGKHEIAAIQTTAMDKEAGLIRLTTTLAHASGEWLSSEWPICPVSETNSPHRLGAALTYARRHSLFALVGIAGDDDTDAPAARAHAGIDASKAEAKLPLSSVKAVSKPKARQNLAALSNEQSQVQRGKLLAELSSIASADELTLWAQRSMPVKNRLVEDHARSVDAAFAQKLAALKRADFEPASALAEIRISTAEQPGSKPADNSEKPSRSSRPRNQGIDKSVLAFPEPKRIRDKAHLKFVAAQPCLICGRAPSDAHHLRFAQPRALGRKVSDEFTVPLCRTHHRNLHDKGDESAFWSKARITPLKIAESLWRNSRKNSDLPSGTAADSSGPTKGDAVVDE